MKVRELRALTNPFREVIHGPVAERPEGSEAKPVGAYPVG